ncbi:conserved exported hypothetical protein [uncultured Paludibacter sp.]|nr:conserved exported hypothetical protein [uncultured Paludibacter sp.]
MRKRNFFLASLLMVAGMSFAQLRPTDKCGINMFETPKTDSLFTGLKVKIGGAMSLTYSMLDHSNSTTTADGYTYNYATPTANSLVPLASNFGLPQANLYVKSNLADGVYLNFELYLASRHHNETWVKGGYLQFDKMPFLPWDFVNEIMKYTTIKVGQFDVNYGDAHFRRSDGGLTFYNPFMENYIMDEFATEIGAEADVHLGDFTVVGAVTNGELSPDLVEIDTVSNRYSNGAHNPALIGKLAFDKKLMDDMLRVRISGSGYYTAGSYKNTLFGGDRTGSNYYGVMYNAGPGTGTAFNGRYNPGFSDKLGTVMGNLFLKFKPVNMLAVETFTTVEKASGRSTKEADSRNANQFAQDVILRLGANENFFVGVRYNTLSADVAKTGTVDAYTAKINRTAISAGWYMTKNIMAKIEYVNQKYDGFPSGNIYDKGKFNGLSAQAAIAF